MTENKPIMIDGVDVLKEKINMCFILLLNKLETSETIEQTIYEHLDAFVDDWNEQLTRKTQECEELKKERDFYSAEYTRVNTQLMLQDAYILIDGKEVWSSDNRKLKQQLDQLTVEKAKLEAQIEADTQYHVKEECNLRKIIRNKEKRNVELHKENNQLKALKEQAEQKLERIREIIKQMNNECFYDYFECKDCDMKNGCTYFNKGKILQIIDEVEEQC